MDHTDYSVPYKEYKELCRILGVKENIYDYKKSFQHLVSAAHHMRNQLNEQSWALNPDRMGQ